MFVENPCHGMAWNSLFSWDVLPTRLKMKETDMDIRPGSLWLSCLSSITGLVGLLMENDFISVGTWGSLQSTRANCTYNAVVKFCLSSNIVVFVPPVLNCWVRVCMENDFIRMGTIWDLYKLQVRTNCAHNTGKKIWLSSNIVAFLCLYCLFSIAGLGFF